MTFHNVADEQLELSYTMSDEEIIDTVVDNFMLLTQVPRPSHHEERISNYLMDWAKEQGLNPVQDSVYNVMFDVPATQWLEDKPLGILQAHMDMVVAVANGKEFDKLSDPITAIRNDEEWTLTADGTSLGADDGAWIALLMAVTQGKIAHGPLRMIITVDEEDGMDGALNISPVWFNGASFLINIDNEWSSEVLVSTAAGDDSRIEKKISQVNPMGNMALKIGILNLKGGHSGVEIDKWRLNGIVWLAKFLRQLDINYELASFEGWTASNAISTRANAVLVIDKNDKELVEQKFGEYCDMIKSEYKGIEDEITCEVNVIEELPQVINQEERDNIIKFITETIDGVYTMSEDMEDLVESSSNLGIARLDSEWLFLNALIRSSSPEMEVKIVNAWLDLAKECGFEVTYKQTSAAWPFDPDSQLLELTKKIYLVQNGEEITVSAVHAGLECGTFKKLKPDLDMVSIGPDLTDWHTIKETLYLNSIPKVWRLLEGILVEYSK